jgi:chemotaxis signal transduction protein
MTQAQDFHNSFVLIHMSGKRFAVPASRVAELSPPVRLHTFPHTTALVSGVIVRRGKIIPVCNANALFGGKRSSANLFYLVAECGSSSSPELLAIPVNGESELASGGVRPPEESSPGYIAGILSAGEESIGVLDLAALAGAVNASQSPAPEVLS